MVEIHTLPILTADLQLSAKGIHFFGMGIPGGEKEHDPSLMPGGNKEAYERLRPIFESIAKKLTGTLCRIFRQRIRG
jgi:6-phosphogluconate dehydrogenase